MALFGAAKIKIDPGFYSDLSTAASERGYSSVDEMAEHLLRDALRASAPAAPSDEDRKLAEEQLRGLGYLK